MRHFTENAESGSLAGKSALRRDNCPLTRMRCSLPERTVDHLARPALARVSRSLLKRAVYELPEAVARPSRPQLLKRAVDHRNALHFGDELLFCTAVTGKTPQT